VGETGANNHVISSSSFLLGPRPQTQVYEVTPQ